MKLAFFLIVVVKNYYVNLALFSRISLPMSKLREENTSIIAQFLLIHLGLLGHCSAAESSSRAQMVRRLCQLMISTNNLQTVDNIVFSFKNMSVVKVLTVQKKIQRQLFIGKFIVYGSKVTSKEVVRVRFLHLSADQMSM